MYSGEKKGIVGLGRSRVGLSIVVQRISMVGLSLAEEKQGRERWGRV